MCQCPGVVCQQTGGLSVNEYCIVLVSGCCVSTDGWTVLESTAVCQCLNVVCVNRLVESLCVNEYCSVSFQGVLCVCQQAGGLSVNEYRCVSVSGCVVCQQTGGLCVNEYRCVSVPGCGVCEQAGGLSVNEYMCVSARVWCV